MAFDASSKRLGGHHIFAFMPDASGEAVFPIRDNILHQRDGRISGQWTGTCKILRPAPVAVANGTDATREQLVFQSTGRFPGEIFCLVDRSVFVAAETGLETVVARSKNLWAQRQTCTLDGESFELPDGLVAHICVVTVGQPRGIILEVGLQPSPAAAVHLRTKMDILAASLMPRGRTADFSVAKVGLDPFAWTAAHAAYGYLKALCDNVL